MFNYSYENSNELFSNKNILIILLTVLLVFSFLGINVLYVVGEFLQKVSDLIKPLVYQILSIFGYTAGTVINTTADVVADTSKFGIDIAEGSVKNIGNLLKNTGNMIDINKKKEIDSSVYNFPSVPMPIETSHPIQTGESSSTNKWCLVGEYQQKRGCIEVTDHDKCMSGQVFPNQKMCLNPTMTPM
jgi:hypothetical protein